MKLSLSTAAAVLCCAACTHSDSFSNTGPTVGPFSTGTDVQLTFNADQDYWPTWTQDGKGILYAYVDLEHPTHRCMGLLAPTGGTRVWQFCDSRAARTDTSVSYGAFALDTTGRLLYTEAVAPSNRTPTPTPVVTVWLADTTAPLKRLRLAMLPQTVGHTVITWLSDLTWTGPSSFIGLGQHIDTWAKDEFSISRDSVFTDSASVVVVGNIASNQLTFQAIAGTEGATAYSLASSGGAVVFTLLHDLRLFSVPISGGVPSPAPRTGLDTLRNQVGELIGVSCKAATCITAKSGVLATANYWDTLRKLGAWATIPGYARILTSLPGSVTELRRVLIPGGTTQVAAASIGGAIYASPHLSPTSGDLVVQVGGGFGQLQTFGTSGGNLHLLRGIGP